MIPVDEPEVPVIEPISISSLDAEHFDDLSFAPFQLVGKVVITHSFKEGDNSNTSSGEANVTPSFRNLGQKKSKPIVNPMEVSVSPIIMEPLVTPTIVLV